MDDRPDLYEKCAEVLRGATALQVAIYEVLDENGVTRMGRQALGGILDKLTADISALRMKP